MYEFAHFGRSVVTAIEANYELAEQSLPNGFVFRPRGPSAKVDTPRSY
jgi:hypothetical protein